MAEPEQFEMPKDAVGFSVFRFEPDRSYTPVEFERGYQGCEIIHRRMRYLAIYQTKKNLMGL